MTASMRLTCALLAGASALAACGGSSEAPPSYGIGGTLLGLVDGTSVVLANNHESLTVSANGAFTFQTAVTQGGSYDVTVGTQPNAQACVVTDGSGTNVMAAVTTVGVTCAPLPQYA
jgi:hypothetical protein